MYFMYSLLFLTIISYGECNCDNPRPYTEGQTLNLNIRLTYYLLRCPTLYQYEILSKQNKNIKSESTAHLPYNNITFLKNLTSDMDHTIFSFTILNNDYATCKRKDLFKLEYDPNLKGDINILADCNVNLEKQCDFFEPVTSTPDTSKPSYSTKTGYSDQKLKQIHQSTIHPSTLPPFSAIVPSISKSKTDNNTTLISYIYILIIFVVLIIIVFLYYLYRKYKTQNFINLSQENTNNTTNHPNELQFVSNEPTTMNVGAARQPELLYAELELKQPKESIVNKKDHITYAEVGFKVTTE
ncbi:uncharacterized protein LOC113514322 [Galleria mellonella]|uniref:Uncharacterized protein LOC113514322 n=1 Tax=Galleria mellonella TaxID=7137 RepID=A0A6J1WQT1_GALME|nr:uncharacterized protein LOC113514322 [Galleria mellonella]